jgi:hypothetical protein
MDIAKRENKNCFFIWNTFYVFLCYPPSLASGELKYKNISVEQSQQFQSIKLHLFHHELHCIVNCLPQRTTGNAFTETKIIHIFVYFLRQCNYTYYSALKNLTTDTNRSEYYGTSQRQEIFMQWGCHCWSSWVGKQFELGDRHQRFGWISCLNLHTSWAMKMEAVR